MHSFHVVAWLDHTEAHVIHFNRDESQTDIIKSAHKPHLHVKAGGNGGRTGEDRAYLEQVVSAVKDAEAILLTGPGTEKTVLYKYLLKQHPAVAEKVVSVESSDHPTDGQLLAYARKFFIASDRMRLSV
ncbi:translational machinery protein [Ramlibacter sp. MAHUQ-53]|uniref:translational machinery protein n=1 Tax=unclassified Ramlibacter TaxID=2617605 RepID=UPI00362CF872